MTKKSVSYTQYGTNDTSSELPAALTNFWALPQRSAILYGYVLFPIGVLALSATWRGAMYTYAQKLSENCFRNAPHVLVVVVARAWCSGMSTNWYRGLLCEFVTYTTVSVFRGRICPHTRSRNITHIITCQWRRLKITLRMHKLTNTPKLPLPTPTQQMLINNYYVRILACRNGYFIWT